MGRASEMGFISRWPPGPPEPDSRGTAAERGARKGLDSPGRRAGTAEKDGGEPMRHQEFPELVGCSHELPERLLTCGRGCCHSGSGATACPFERRRAQWFDVVD